MATKTEPILSDLVAQGLAIIARRDAKAAECEAKGKELQALEGELKSLEAELDVVDQGLIALGGGRYRNEENHVVSVVPGVPKTLSADTFVLPEGGIELARTYAGDEFRKLFDRKEVFTPRNGFDAIAEVLLTPKRCRDLVALCVVPGALKGGRAAYVRWK